MNEGLELRAIGLDESPGINESELGTRTEWERAFRRFERRHPSREFDMCDTIKADVVEHVESKRKRHQGPRINHVKP